MVDNFIPEKVSFKFEMVVTNPKEMIWNGYNTDGVKTSELKFVKVK